MKIAIMTQPLGKNYGGMMQAFALQKVLKNMGHEVVTIDRQPAGHGIVHNSLRLIYRSIQKIKGKRKAPVNIERHYPLIFNNPHGFIKNNIKISESFFSTEKLKSHFSNNSYDAVVVGSDQTWRPRYSPDIYNFYLDFLSCNNVKRVAYASSFGVDSWEYSAEETKRCAELAKQFDAISVRETSGIELCDKYLGVKSEFVLDPTLLLEKEDYLELIGDRYRNDAGEGVFTYWLDRSDEKRVAAEQLANQLNTYSYQCQAKNSINSLNSSNLKNYKMPPVEDWLASFAKASVVLTDSFHGMVFSIIFQKPFVVVVNKERGASRFISLLNKLGLEERLVDKPESISYDLLMKPLDGDVLKILKDYQVNSKNFLDHYLVDC
ncbi:polysaccharide pyruvyl transferase family protein [Marinobacterium rhizophilum]|uniref:Polysaccharide pyruvyl transferase family protein n=1 Tax=Marinobacterium rhizophilum TaxID=420402 RepID=A0ABY5HE55_9GAMM|nr:polysaccharide pyruvyl transferase family protein [Marinobacterium rhizophilum]UTW10633.1 polysaccharide pyruvyl transferase family protein [Marinobacterium rhizophilum]